MPAWHMALWLRPLYYFIVITLVNEHRQGFQAMPLAAFSRGASRRKIV
jgi:hypothetical protein